MSWAPSKKPPEHPRATWNDVPTTSPRSPRHDPQSSQTPPQQFFGKNHNIRDYADQIWAACWQDSQSELDGNAYHLLNCALYSWTTPEWNTVQSHKLVLDHRSYQRIIVSTRTHTHGRVQANPFNQMHKTYRRRTDKMGKLLMCWYLGGIIGGELRDMWGYVGEDWGG